MSKQQFTRRFQILEYTPDTEKRALVPEQPTFIEGITASLAARPACTHLNVHFSGLRLREIGDNAPMPAKWCRIIDAGDGSPQVDIVHNVLSNGTAPEPSKPETEAEMEARAAVRSKESLAKLRRPKKGKRA